MNLEWHNRARENTINGNMLTGVEDRQAQIFKSRTTVNNMKRQIKLFASQLNIESKSREVMQATICHND